jgi:hypothetical protein
MRLSTKRIVTIIGILVALIAFLVPLTPVAATNQSVDAPRIHVKSGTSTNWSGMALLTRQDLITARIVLS